MKTSKKLFMLPFVVIFASSLLLSACDIPIITKKTCTFTKQEATTDGRFGNLLLKYFHAINNQDYTTAFNLLSTDVQNTFATEKNGKKVDALKNFTNVYKDHVKCVRVTSMKNAGNKFGDLVSASMGLQWYQVEFEATYKTPFDAADGKLPAYYKMQCDPHADNALDDQIISISTGN